MKYLSVMKSDPAQAQTLSLYSGHPLGCELLPHLQQRLRMALHACGTHRVDTIILIVISLFPSPAHAPRLVITNGMVIPNYSRKEDLDRMYAIGVSQFGQMTAGSFCCTSDSRAIAIAIAMMPLADSLELCAPFQPTDIGPQGIVHGTTITILNAGRKYLGSSELAGKVYVSSGLGGMSGAQAKAAVICGAIGVVAEVNGTTYRLTHRSEGHLPHTRNAQTTEAALRKRHEQGWVIQRVDTLDDCIARIKAARAAKEATSIAYLGNIVDLWERLAAEEELLVDLGSDQTSLV